MKSEDIKALNKLENDDDAQLEKLVDFYKKGKISVDDLLAQNTLELRIPANVINFFAVKLSNGKNDIKKDKKRAHQLFLHAAKKGDGWANRNAGNNYLRGQAGEKKNILEAIKFLVTAAPKLKDDKKSDCDYLLGEAHLENGNKKEAIACFKKIKSADKDNYPKANSRIEEILSGELRKLYPKVNAEDEDEVDDAADKVEKFGLEEKQPKADPTWIKVSAVLDGYDLDAKINKQRDEVNKRESELKDYEKLFEFADGKVFQAKANKVSKKELDVLTKKREELKKAKDKADDELDQANERLKVLTEYAEAKEFQRQVQTEKHFFSSHRTKEEQTQGKALALQANRLATEEKEIKDVSVDGIPVRRMITAENSTITASLEVFGRKGSDYSTEYGWHVAKVEEYKGYEIKRGHWEKVKMGDSDVVYRQRTNPHRNHVGDYFMKDLGEYKDIISTLNSITGTNAEGVQVDNEKKLATCMLKYTQKGTVLTLARLRQIKAEATEQDVIDLNRIFYHCFVKEIVRWMQPRDENHELPFPTAQRRAVKLIEMGHLSINDVFSQYAPYGVFTGKNIGENIEVVRNKIRRINRLYVEAALKPEPGHFKKHMRFFKDHENGVLVTTRQQLHLELREGYGGASDTDGEGYDSDTAHRLYECKL